MRIFQKESGAEEITTIGTIEHSRMLSISKNSIFFDFLLCPNVPTVVNKK